MVGFLHRLLSPVSHFKALWREYWQETWFVYLIVIIMIVGAVWTAESLAYVIVGGF